MSEIYKVKYGEGLITDVKKGVLIDDDFETILICAVRYALGRQTYMPKLVVDYIVPLIPFLDFRTLSVMRRDLKPTPSKYYGDEIIDKPMWLEFLRKIEEEMEERKNARDII